MLEIDGLKDEMDYSIVVRQMKPRGPRPSTVLMVHLPVRTSSYEGNFLTALWSERCPAKKEQRTRSRGTEWVADGFPHNFLRPWCEKGASGIFVTVRGSDMRL